MKKNIFIYLIIVALILSFTGCFNINTQNKDEGVLQIYLTDAVVPISEVENVFVNIESIYLYGSQEGYPPLQVTDEPQIVDLLTLIGTEYNLATVEGTGTYNQIRFEVSDATITVLSEDYGIEVNSSTIKLNVPIVFDEDPVVLLDFDLSKSLKVQGQWNPENPGKVHMTPVVTARYGIKYDITGIISPHEDIYLLALESIETVDSTCSILTTFTHNENPVWEEGEFRFLKVSSGDYMLKIFNKEIYNLENFNVEEDEPDMEIEIQLENSDLDLGTINIE